MKQKLLVTNNDNGIVKINTRNKWFNLLVIGLCFLFLLGVRLQVNGSTTGDEPHYLSMDYELVHKGNLNLADVYKYKEYLSYYPSPNLLPQSNPAIANINSSKVYSTHGVGLPILLLPGFYIAAKTGAVFEMILLAALVVCLTWVWTKKVTGNRKVAYVASGFLLICYFFNGLAGYIYPDMLTAVITLVALIMVENYYSKFKFQIILGLIIGFLVLVHIRNLDLVLPILAVLTYKLWKNKLRLPWITYLLVLLFITYYFLSLHKWFGVWNVNTVYGPATPTFGLRAFDNVSAMLFDSNSGLLIYNPILLLLFIGLPIWFKKHRESFLITVVAVLPSMIVLALYNGWGGGYAPAGRYIIDFLPVFMPAMAFAIMKLNKIWQRAIIVVFALLTLLVTIDNMLTKFPLINGSLFYTRASLFIQIQRHTRLALDHLIPNYSTSTILISRHGFIKLLISYLLVILLILYGFYLNKPKQSLKKALNK